ncbi:MAG: hypothetical protein R2713_20055 [Ilumatobacteraceae bacterium]
MNGAITPMRPTPFLARLTAIAFGVNPSSSMTASTRSSVAGATRDGLFSACDTVAIETPACSATS